MRICGIDPGLTGAIAFVDFDIDGRTAHVTDVDIFDMPVTTELDGRPMPDARTTAAIMRNADPDLIILEHVESRPGQGTTSAFRFAQGFGATLAAAQLCHPLDGRVHLVRPRVWKPRLELTDDKNLSLELARNLFPSAAQNLSRKKDDGRAEALLLTEYWRRVLLVSGEMECI